MRKKWDEHRHKGWVIILKSWQSKVIVHVDISLRKLRRRKTTELEVKHIHIQIPVSLIIIYKTFSKMFVSCDSFLLSPNEDNISFINYLVSAWDIIGGHPRNICPPFFLFRGHKDYLQPQVILMSMQTILSWRN
jgi:hypothetical protein